MKNDIPTWPQTLLICALGTVFCVLGYILSRRHTGWDTSTLAFAGLLTLCGLAFLSTIYFFYMRPQYGSKALPALVVMLLGHAALVALLVKTGVA